MLIVIAVIALAWGLTKRNATEMAVTNKRVLIKTGLGNRRTLDLMLSRVESIGVEETFFGRMLGYGSVTLRGTGGTPESFVMISHPQEFRRSVQAQIGHVEPMSTVPPVPPEAAVASRCCRGDERWMCGRRVEMCVVAARVALRVTERQVFN